MKKPLAIVSVFLSIITMLTLTACGAKTLSADEYAKAVYENYIGWQKNVTLWSASMSDNSSDKAAELVYIAECRKHLNDILAVKTDDGEFAYISDRIRSGTENELKWCDAAEKISNYQGNKNDTECQALMNELSEISSAETTLPIALLELVGKCRETTGKSVSELLAA